MNMMRSTGNELIRVITREKPGEWHIVVELPNNGIEQKWQLKSPTGLSLEALGLQAGQKMPQGIPYTRMVYMPAQAATTRSVRAAQEAATRPPRVHIVTKIDEVITDDPSLDEIVYATPRTGRADVNIQMLPRGFDIRQTPIRIIDCCGAFGYLIPWGEWKALTPAIVPVRESGGLPFIYLYSIAGQLGKKVDEDLVRPSPDKTPREQIVAINLDKYIDMNSKSVNWKALADTLVSIHNAQPRAARTVQFTPKNEPGETVQPVVTGYERKELTAPVGPGLELRDILNKAGYPTEAVCPGCHGPLDENGKCRDKAILPRERLIKANDELIKLRREMAEWKKEPPIFQVANERANTIKRLEEEIKVLKDSSTLAKLLEQSCVDREALKEEVEKLTDELRNAVSSRQGEREVSNGKQRVIEDLRREIEEAKGYWKKQFEHAKRETQDRTREKQRLFNRFERLLQRAVANGVEVRDILNEEINPQLDCRSTSPGLYITWNGKEWVHSCDFQGKHSGEPFIGFTHADYQYDQHTRGWVYLKHVSVDPPRLPDVGEWYIDVEEEHEHIMVLNHTHDVAVMVKGRDTLTRNEVACHILVALTLPQVRFVKHVEGLPLPERLETKDIPPSSKISVDQEGRKDALLVAHVEQGGKLVIEDGKMVVSSDPLPAELVEDQPRQD
jgi:hypothetical protein